MRPPRFLAHCLVTGLVALGPAGGPPHAASASTLTTPTGPPPAPAGVVAVPARAVAATASAGPARAGCPAGGVEVDLAGSGDTAVVSGHAAAACGATSGPHPANGPPRPYWTYEIACSPDHVRAAQGVCSMAPCAAGLYFAFRTLHRPDGRTEAAGYFCVSPERAQAGPTLTAADVFAAVRRVKLPTGAIRVAPGGGGLANLPSRLWLVGDSRPPVDLRLAGSTVHAEFQPIQYRWTIESGAAAADGSGGRLPQPGGADADGSADGPGGGLLGPGRDGAWTVPARADPSGHDAEVALVFPGRGDFVVSVVTTWSATAFLDGRYVGQVDGLVSTARIAYPVAELHAALSG